MKKQVRKSQVSIRGATYNKLKAYVEACRKDNSELAHFSVSAFVDNLCAGFFAKGDDQVKTARARTEKGNGDGADVDARKMNF